MEVMDGCKKAPLSAIGPYKMGILLSMALNMDRSLHLTNGYLLKEVFQCHNLFSTNPYSLIELTFGNSKLLLKSHATNITYAMHL